MTLCVKTTKSLGIVHICICIILHLHQLEIICMVTCPAIYQDINAETWLQLHNPFYRQRPCWHVMRSVFCHVNLRRFWR